MNKGLLIVGAGIYGVVAMEIASNMGVYDRIDFVDDTRTIAPNGKKVIGTIDCIKELSCKYQDAVVAIGNSEIRMSLIKRLMDETNLDIVSLVSPRAYVSPSACLMRGCIVEPMAVINSKCIISDGCIISAGAVLNHESLCGECAHIDCGATVAAGAIVPKGTKVCYGEVFK